MQKLILLFFKLFLILKLQSLKLDEPFIYFPSLIVFIVKHLMGFIFIFEKKLPVNYIKDDPTIMKCVFLFRLGEKMYLFINVLVYYFH